jgi:hypothetical protein
MTNKTSIPAVGGGADLIARLPELVQEDIIIHCSGDKSGNIYSARVLGVDGRRIRINLPRRIAGHGYLRTSRPVVMAFVLSRQLYQCPANYNADDEKIRELEIQGEIKPATRRNHKRNQLQINTGYTPVSDFSLARGQFAALKWKKGMTLDISGGGLLFRTPFQPPADSYFLINLEIPAFQGPFFVFGQVRWVGLCDTNRQQYLCGVRFLLREELPHHFSERALSELPAIIISFDKKMQKELEAYLEEHSGHRNQGENDDQ